MAKKPKFGLEAPNLADAASGDEARLFHDIVRRRGPLPAGVQRVEFRFGEDSTGAPAVWIVFIAKDDLKPSSESINAIRRAAEEVRSEVRRTSSERWPYITIEAE
jgi:hypothetical protein